jgi:beta-glucanase (GH16 family)
MAPELFSNSKSVSALFICRRRESARALIAISVPAVVVFLLSFLPVVANAQASASPAKDAKWKLAWSDEFNGPTGSAVDPSKWVFDLGGKGWGNQELESYTNRPQNVYIQDGNLVIQAREESYTGADGVSRNYTSARLKTAGKFSQTYGRFEARIKIPFGQGLWPAFWMLGDDFGKIGWPAAGEIDVMENIGKEPSTVHGTIHGPGYSGDGGIGAPFTLPGNRRFSDDFHIYAVEWEPDTIRFYVDDKLYETCTPSSLPARKKWVYDHAFFLLLNVAVGGAWPGNPDATTIFPQTMLVDYVRVYQRSSQ